MRLYFFCNLEPWDGPLVKKGYFYSLLDGMLVHCRVSSSNELARTQKYTWVERGTMRVKCLAQEHNTVAWPELKPGLLS